MFKSLHHWFDELAQQGKLFPGDDATADAVLASVLLHLIRADGIESTREKAKFEQILADEFGVDHAYVRQLYENVQHLDSTFDEDLETLKSHLKDNPNVRMTLFRSLNQLIALDGIDTSEIEAFNHAVEVMFPEVALQKE